MIPESDPEARCLPHDPAPQAPIAPMPALACDCHAHVCGPQSRYEYIEQRIYTPPDALPADFRSMLDALGIERGVLVQPSVYGTDNRAMEDALARDPLRLRGVAVLPADVDASELDRLHRLGVRGVRCNIVDLKEGAGILPMEYIRALASRVAPLGWHIEFLIHVDEFPDLDRQLGSLPVPLVFGHMGYAPAHKGATDGFRALLRLMRDGRAWTKMTAPYRLAAQEFPYSAVDETAHQLIEEAPQRLLWGSDWPHVNIRSGMPNDGGLLNLFIRWVGDAAKLERILVDNPAQVYDFG